MEKMWWYFIGIIVVLVFAILTWWLINGGWETMQAILGFAEPYKAGAPPA